MDKCASCPVIEGECFARRSKVRRLCAIPKYRDLLAAWGPSGGPENVQVRDRKAIPPGVEVLDEWSFVTTEQLARDTRRLFRLVPRGVDMVVAISRSGFAPGSILAYLLHVPLWGVSRQTGVANLGHGSRLENRPFVSPRHVLLVDDTVASGREMAACAAIVREHFPEAEVTRAVVYAHPQSLDAVDIFVAAYPGEHYLEWNWNNAGHGAACGYDFDGILCEDCPVEDDDDGDRYRRFLAEAVPLYLPRRTRVPLIVTARHEKYRGETLAWLDRHRVEVDRLVMRTFDYDPSRRLDQIATYKAEHYAASDVVIFAESERIQAERIAEITGRPVLCPVAGRVFPGRPLEVVPVVQGEAEAAIRERHAAKLDRAKACGHRSDAKTCGCEAGQAVCALGRGSFDGGRVAALSDCLQCEHGGGV